MNYSSLHHIHLHQSCSHLWMKFVSLERSYQNLSDFGLTATLRCLSRDVMILTQ